MTSHSNPLEGAKTVRRKAPVVSEHALQLSVTQYLRLALPADVVWTAVDHAARISPRQGRARKDRGVKKGQPDYRFILPPHGRSAEIELKREGAYQEPEQKAWQAATEAAGGLYAVCRSVDDVTQTLAEWGALR